MKIEIKFKYKGDIYSKVVEFDEERATDETIKKLANSVSMQLSATIQRIFWPDRNFMR